MFNSLDQIGMFGLPFVMIILAILSLTVKYGIKLWSQHTATPIDINSVLYLGIFALSLGLFSHFLGLYQASGIVAQLRTEQIAAGYGQSLVALLWGFVIFFISAISWFVLRFQARKLQSPAG